MAENEFLERTRLIEEVYRGRMRPEDAEAEAQRQGFQPLCPDPDISQFDPMTTATWTLPMAIAWVSWRTADRVRDNWDEFRQQNWYWASYQARTPINGGQEWEYVSGYELSVRGPASLTLLSFSEGDDPTFMSIQSAVEALWKALASGNLTAAAIPGTGNPVPIQIPAYEWPYLQHSANRNFDDELRFQHGPLAYHNVTFQRVEILRIWAINEPGRRAGNSLSGASNRSPAQAKVKVAIGEIYPQGIPPVSEKSNKEIISEVATAMQQKGIAAPSNDTILRAAGRKKISGQIEQIGHAFFAS